MGLILGPVPSRMPRLSHITLVRTLQSPGLALSCLHYSCLFSLLESSHFPLTLSTSKDTDGYKFTHGCQVFQFVWFDPSLQSPSFAQHQALPCASGGLGPLRKLGPGCDDCSRLGKSWQSSQCYLPSFLPSFYVLISPILLLVPGESAFWKQCWIWKTWPWFWHCGGHVSIPAYGATFDLFLALLLALLTVLITLACLQGLGTGG